MRVVILGAGGMLGHDLVKQAPPNVDLRAFTHAEVDVTNCDLVSATMVEAKPTVLINAAAYTAVDRAEAEEDVAFRVNATAVGAMGILAARSRVRVVHVSTDYVFDGETGTPYSEESEPRPIGVYGASKLAGETALKESGAEYLVIRAQWLFGSNGRSFPRTMWERARSGAATKVVNDQHGRPTYTADLAGAIWMLVTRGVTGTRHVANVGEATWFDVAAHVFQRANRADLLTGCLTKDYPTAARRPRYGALSTDRFEQDAGGPLRHWRDALNEFLTLLEG